MTDRAHVALAAQPACEDRARQPGLGLLLVAIAVALSIGALLLVRRRAPSDGFFTDGDRAAGVFGVLATGVALLLGFVIFLAFETYDASRSGARRRR